MFLSICQIQSPVLLLTNGHRRASGPHQVQDGVIDAVKLYLYWNEQKLIVWVMSLTWVYWCCCFMRCGVLFHWFLQLQESLCITQAGSTN